MIDYYLYSLNSKLCFITMAIIIIIILNFEDLYFKSILNFLEEFILLVGFILLAQVTKDAFFNHFATNYLNYLDLLKLHFRIKFMHIIREYYWVKVV